MLCSAEHAGKDDICRGDGQIVVDSNGRWATRSIQKNATELQVDIPFVCRRLALPPGYERMGSPMITAGRR